MKNVISNPIDEEEPLQTSEEDKDMPDQEPTQEAVIKVGQISVTPPGSVINKGQDGEWEHPNQHGKATNTPKTAPNTPPDDGWGDMSTDDGVPDRLSRQLSSGRPHA